MIQLGLSAFMLLMGSSLVLVALGLIPTDDQPGLLGRAVMLLFGGVIAVMGGRFLLTPLGILVEAAARNARRSPWALAAGRLLRRIDVQSSVAALALVPITTGYWREVSGGNWWGPSRDTLIGLVPIEFFLLHGFPFLAIAASFARLPERPARWIGGAGVLGLLALYSAFAWGVFDGPSGVVALLYLALPNVMAFLRAQSHWAVRTGAATRWGIKFILFVGVAMVLNERTLNGAGNLALGLGYFTILTLCELFRITELPLDLAEAWARLPAAQRAPGVQLTTSTGE